MGTPLGPKYIPYTYMDPLGAGEIILLATQERDHVPVAGLPG